MKMNLLFTKKIKNRDRVEESLLTNFLNNKTPKTVKWCTPSLDFDSAQVKNPYLSDMSISYEIMGVPSEPSGIFKTIYDLAALAYGADKTLFSVNGTTGSNFIVLRALSKQFPNLRVLAQRNVHKSVVAACEDYGINLIFLPPNIDQELQIFLPNSEEQILAYVKKTKPQVLLLTNPTYEGFTLNLKRITEQIRKKYPDIIIFIEEAWGSHLHFSNNLPSSAMESGADICVQSTHKQGGALQQSGMIHWKNGRINEEILMDSYRSLTTTSPSFLLLASLDAAREMMQKRGSVKIDYLLKLANLLTEEIQAIPGIEVVKIDKLKKKNPTVYDNDETKILLDVTKTGYTGFEIARVLEDTYKIIVEKYSENTILLIVPLHANGHDVKKTVNALDQIIKQSAKTSDQNKIHLKIPTNIPKILDFSDVTKLLWNQIEKVPLDKAEGRIAAEHITPYPPGIPLTIKGEEFTAEIIKYYLEFKNHPNAHIVAQDKTMTTVLVVK